MGVLYHVMGFYALHMGFWSLGYKQLITSRLGLEDSDIKHHISLIKANK